MALTGNTASGGSRRDGRRRRGLSSPMGSDDTHSFGFVVVDEGSDLETAGEGRVEAEGVRPGDELDGEAEETV